ncbi:MAG: Coenzyme F420 hydrogenase/dehydrogenase, beta subunit C-terminal domain [Ilumatobacter sp.]|uniref:Coenzyme F420 hydrogenase/dehydrogenase, beta subunit C-terminal domain n=1 Tax=Ilumatobacter sp. TaxID=1967498 RepID=UPI00260EA302|nr:Coenzyme F420 hydrogenase/dehydrogenase, beta subunit C-terminal domain [Ilumatobacter sp.]MDJ0770435.1 Coenzyme F420 hydrogenase/dehydrogenase, beta subunit C-terminal domain [Ilumatobacter sp.]
MATTIADIVGSDLCIGCGLCEAVTGGRVRMELTGAGSLRPVPLDGFRSEEEVQLVTACPGIVASPRAEPGQPVDDVWGSYRSMSYAWAGDPDVRFRAATGGVLTALGTHLLADGQVAFVLHVGADPEHPVRSRWVISETPADVLANSGSRYGPTAPLAGLCAALDRQEAFAIIAKPCDLSAVHSFSRVDERVDRWCVARLALVCGGQSRLSKTLGVLDRLGVAEDEVASLRYRGNGNPGPTRIQTVGGAAHEVTYLEMWADEATWAVETRCKLCPDALGEAADVAAADAWPGGAPVGEDQGFNAIVVRTAAGEALVDDAVAAGRLVVGGPITPREFDDLQPHQVRKKVALAARYEGLADAGAPPIAADGLRLDALGARLAADGWQAERDGAARRIEEARS